MTNELLMIQWGNFLAHAAPDGLVRYSAHHPETGDKMCEVLSYISDDTIAVLQSDLDVFEEFVTLSNLDLEGVMVLGLPDEPQDDDPAIMKLWNDCKPRLN